MGYTPWGTYLTCEENFQFYFVNRSGSVPPLQQRYGITARGGGYRWHEFDERFDAARHPNEPSRFGWVVEIDPFDPSRPPLKRTALGRFKHEGAALSVAPDRRVAFYMADDERFEHVYKFVSRDPANRDALDHGTLYVARFDADGTGAWLELAAGRNGLDAGAGFRPGRDLHRGAPAGTSRGGRMVAGVSRCIRTGEACALSYNETRGDGRPGPDPANPRARTCTATSFAGASAAAIRPRRASSGTSSSSAATLDDARTGARYRATFRLAGRAVGRTGARAGSDRRVHPAPPQGNHAAMGNNQMLAADPVTRDGAAIPHRPNGCEITGATGTEDGRTLFVNVQHPGETTSGRTNPAAPKAISAWPDGPSGGRPRSATVAIRRADGGPIGT
jgi:secreted PhoX family phosphatase